MAGRPMLPRDIWNVSGIMSGGTDSAVLKEKVKELWGRYPLDTYTCTEGCVIATQTWDYDTMTFIPNLNFLEFIHEDECYKEQFNAGYRPKTVLLNEVRPDELYEIVLTNFHGGALVRYRIGDMVRIAGLRNEKLNINLPQMTFERRTDDLIDLGGYVRLTERTVWQALENSGIPYEDWTVRKEAGEKPLAYIYLELKDGYAETEEKIGAMVYGEIKKLDKRINSSSIYNTLENILGTTPVKVRLLPPGSFPNYVMERKREGAELAHLKPPHVNPSDEVLEKLGARRYSIIG
jgi:phenylacetate-coenzyme A ligase PaaK-like adenylate-forming protein